MCHLQAALKRTGGRDGDFARSLARLWEALLRTPERFPENGFWNLHRAANLSALGEKARPIAVGDTLRRAFASATLSAFSERIGPVLRSAGQFGVAVPSGAEHVAARMRFRHEAGEWIFTYDGRNAFNAMLRAAMMEPLAEVLPEAFEYIAKVYAEVPAQLLFQMANGEMRTIASRRGAQQGDPFGPMLFCLGLLRAQRRFCAAEHAQPIGVRQVGYIDDLGVSARALTPATAAALQRLRADLLTVGIETVPAKSYALAPPGHEPTLAERVLLTTMGLTLAAEGGITSVGVPIGSDEFVRKFAQESIARLECVKLARHLAQMTEHTQSALLLTTQSLCRRLGYLTRTIEPRLLRHTAEAYDNLCVWTMEQLMRLPDSSSADAFFAEEDAGSQQYLSSRHLATSPIQRRQIQMSLSSGGLHLTSAAHSKEAAYVGSMLITIPAMLADLVGANTANDAAFLQALPNTSGVRELQSAVRTLGDRGISQERLNALLPPSWAAWAAPTAPGAPQQQPELNEAWNLDPPRPPLPPTAVATLAAHDCPVVAVRHAETLDHHGALRGRRRPRVPGEGAQAALTHELNKLRFAEFRRSIHALGDVAHIDAAAGLAHENIPLALARHRSQCGAGAMSWITARPSDPSLTLTPMECQAALRRAIGHEEFLAAQCPTPACRRTDADTRHGRHCMHTGYPTRTHHAVRDALSQLLRDINVPNTLEDPTPFTVVASRFVMDITVAAGGLRQSGNASLLRTAALLDVTCVDPHATSNLQIAALGDGAAAARAVAHKIRTYTGSFVQSSYTLWPMAVESYGRWCTPAEEFFNAMATHAVGGSTSDRWREKGAVMHRIRQTLSVTLQRALHRSVSAYRHRVDLERYGAAYRAAQEDIVGG